MGIVGGLVSTFGNWFLNKAVRVWDIASGKCQHSLNGHTGKVQVVAYLLNGTQIVSGSEDGTVRIWDAESGAPLYILESSVTAVRKLICAPNGKQFAFIGTEEDTSIFLWDTQSAKSYDVDNPPTSPLSNLMVFLNPTAEAENQPVKIYLYKNPATRKYEHKGAVLSLAYSPNSMFLASGGEDRVVRLWNLNSLKCELVIQGFEGAIHTIAWTKDASDSDYLVTGCADHSVRVWQLYEKEGQYQARLHWSSIPNVLNVTRTLIQNVEGWDREGNQLNYTLLTQRGAIQEPFVATKARHKDKKLASDVTQLKPKKLASEWSDDYLKFLLEKEDRSSKEERHLWLGLDKMNKVTGASLNHSTTALPPNNPTITPSLPVLHSHFA